MSFFKKIGKSIGKAVKFVGQTAGKAAKVVLPAAVSLIPGVGSALAGGVSAIIGGSGGDPPPQPEAFLPQLEQQAGGALNRVLKHATKDVEVGVKAGFDQKTILMIAGGALGLVLLLRK